MKLRRSLLLTCSSSLALVSLTFSSAQAGTTWDGGGNATTNINTAANWDGDALPTSLTDGTQTLTFGTAGSTATINTDVNVSGLVFNRDAAFTVANGAGNLTIGTGGITVNATTITASRTHWIGETIILNGNQTWSVNNKDSSILGGLNVTGLISGNSALTKTGNGTLTLSNNNTYTGITTLSAGNLSISHANALGATGAGNGTTVSGTTSRLQISGNITAAEAITLSTAAGNNNNMLMSNSGTNTLSGAVNITGANRPGIGLVTGNLTFTGGVTADANQNLLLYNSSSATSGNLLTISGSAINIGSGTLEVNGAGWTALNVAGNTMGTLNIRWTGKVRTGVANAWNSSLNLNIGSENAANANTLDIGGYDQTVGSLTGASISGANNTLTNSGSAATFTVNGTTSTTYDGAITGALALTKQGSSTLTLSGNNTYTGATTISGNGSILAISNANALGATSGNTTVGDRAELRLSGGISVGESITLNGFGAVRNSNAALTSTSGNNTVTGLITLGTEASENWIKSQAGTLNLTGGVSSSNRDLVLTGGGTLNVTTNQINLGTGNLVVFGQGSPAVSIGVGNNTAGKLTVYYGGKLRTDVANAFSSSTTLFMGSSDNSTGSLDLNGYNQTFGNLVSDGTGSVVITSASAATLSVNQTVNNTYRGTITGAVGLTKSGSSTLTLSGNNTYSGGTTVNAGALNVASTGSLASGSAFTLDANGTANFANVGQTLGAVSNANSASNALNFSASSGTVTLASLSGAGNTRFGSNAVVTGGIGSGTVTTVGSLTANITGGTTTVGGVATIGSMSAGTANLNGATSSIGTYNGGNIALGNSTVLSVSGGNSSGIISGGGSLNKTGADKLTLLGINTYTGTTTVSEGTLAINGSVAGAVAVNSNTTLQGSGSIGGALSVSGQLSPGNSIESIGASSVSFLNGSTYAYELNSSVLGGDLLYTTGALSIASTTTLSLTELASGTLAMNDKLTLISYGTWNGGLFTYNGSTLNNGDKFTLGSNEWLFKYDDTTGGSNFLSDQAGATRYITMTVVPEPNVAMVAGSLALMALLRRRRD